MDSHEIPNLSTFSTLRNTSGEDEIHLHYAFFSFHPGWTTLIACVVIVLLLAAYVWADKIKRCIAVHRRYFCHYHENSLRDPREEIEMIGARQQGPDLSSDTPYLDGTDTDFDVHSLDSEELKSKEQTSPHQEEKLQVDGVRAFSLQSGKQWSLSMSPINTSAFPQLPVILFTPATPLPLHQSFGKEAKQSSTVSVNTTASDGTASSFTESEVTGSHQSIKI